jgi:hypothetical protein
MAAQVAIRTLILRKIGTEAAVSNLVIVPFIRNLVTMCVKSKLKVKQEKYILFENVSVTGHCLPTLTTTFTHINFFPEVCTTRTGVFWCPRTPCCAVENLS